MKFYIMDGSDWNLILGKVLIKSVTTGNMGWNLTRQWFC